MTPQELADDLARLAGWKMLDIMQTGNATGPVWCGPNGQRARNHPFLVGSLDALEAFRRERLPGTILSYLHDYSDQCGEVDPRFRCEASIVRMEDGRPRGVWVKEGRTMWYAYASALVAAAREESK